MEIQGSHGLRSRRTDRRSFGTRRRRLRLFTAEFADFRANAREEFAQVRTSARDVAFGQLRTRAREGSVSKGGSAKTRARTTRTP